MKNLLYAMSIAVILFASSCKEVDDKSRSQNQEPTDSSITSTPAAPKTVDTGVHTAVVEEVIHTTSYTYLRVKEGGVESWLAIPKKEVPVGETISYKDPMPMSNFKSKELDRTFETVYFLAGVTSQSAAKVDPPKKPTEVTTVPGNLISAAGVHTAVVEEIINTTSYTYLKLKEGDVDFWVAIQKRPMTVGETISFEQPMEMRNFQSRELQKIFEVIYFLGKITKASDPVGKVPAGHPKIPTVKKEVTSEKIEITPAQGGLTIGKLFADRDSYSGKVVQIKGKVTKFNKGIMGRNWVHLQDGTGGAGTNDLLVTTQEIVSVGDVVEFQGMIVLNKDFGAGYSYEVLMEKGKVSK